MKIKKLLIGMILLTILILPIVYSVQQKVYILNLKYDNGKVTKESLIVTQGIFIEESQPREGYRLELISFKDKILYTQKFIFSELQKGPMPEESDMVEKIKYLPDITEKEPSLLKTSSVELMIPYYGEAKTIKIYDINDVKVLEIDISSFAEKERPSGIWNKFISWFKKLFGK